MKLPSRFLAFVTLASALFLTGCIQVDTVVKLKPDGTGTIEQKTVMGAAVIQQMKAMSAFGGEAGKAAKAPEMFDEVKLKEQAAKMGEGVTYVSGKKITTPDGGEGVEAIYAFTDINKVKVSGNPADFTGNMGGDVKVKSSTDAEPVTFQFTKGKPAELVVKTPVPKADAKKKEDKPAQDEAMQDAMMPMMQQMLKGMRMSIAIEVAGKITETNAQFKDASRVTLMDVEFDKVLADPAKFKAMSKIKDPNSTEAKALLKSIPGIKVETVNPLKIRFQ